MDDAEARAILTEHGEEPPKRGRLAPHWHDLAETFRADAPPGDDYDDPDVAAAFGTDDVTEAAPPPMEPERRPQRVRAPRKKAAVSFRERMSKARAKPKKKHPRISTAPITSTLWAGLGGIVMRRSAPTGRCLVFQAEAAGDILDDLVKGTIADPALQWLARGEEKGRKGAALFGPPAVVALIEQAQLLPEEQRIRREAFLLPLLVRLLMLWDEASAEKTEERLERVRLEGPRQQQAEELATLILNGVREPEPASAA